MARAVNVVALVKDNEKFIFLYDNDSTAELMRTLGRFAGNSELNFSWYDAAVLSQKVRRLADKVNAEEQPPRPIRVPR